eukprot:TRINITY_DN7516_c0_g1_i1.p1 TRINITY_DN7516_c0_g1~~TRINITY_DN7516_c0_g1_i1.p1  ORF type:complete len:480 (+),score=52.83 TRINITY_DN7516_c0_g1_i1:75-1514(+)
MPRGIKLQKLRFTSDKKALENLPCATAEDIADFRHVVSRFQQYLQGSYPASTARNYAMTISRLFRIHRKAPAAMVSKQYRNAVRGMGLHGCYSACLGAFGQFHGCSDARGTSSIPANAKANDGREISKKRKADANDKAKPVKIRCSARTTKALAHLENASVTDIESIPRVLAGFKKHLMAKFPDITSNQYFATFRRLLIMHKKAPKVMASKEYLDAIHGLRLRFAQVAAVKAFCGFWGVDVADDIFSQRQRANSEAHRRLALAQEHGRPISDADVLAVLRLWRFLPNRFRTNVLPKGVDSVDSCTLGLISDRAGHSLISNSTHGSEHVVRLLCQWLQDQLGRDQFPFTSISINKGYAAAVHRDKGNKGPSAARAIGNFRGGELRYWRAIPANVDLRALRKADSVLLDSRHGVAFFDGNRPHGVEDFTGERFSAVFFTANMYQRASAAVCKKLKSFGIQWPEPGTLQCAQSLVAESLGGA